jgi:hypothetical protein
MKLLRADSRLLLVFLLSSISSEKVLAYGTEGHRVVANLAWYLLPRQVKDEIYDLLDKAELGYYCKHALVCA